MTLSRSSTSLLRRCISFVAVMPLLAGCAGADDISKSNDESGSAPLAGSYGCDYSYARPSPSHLQGEGYRFVARYFSHDSGKNLSASEAASLEGAGLAIVSNWEAGGDDALGGYNTGVQQAQTAQAQADAAGAPASRPIYFSVDFDAAENQQGAINDYFDGVASVLGVERTGAYAGYYVVQRLFDAGKITWAWQASAWSGGQWDPRAHIRQVAIGLEGDTIDKDQAMFDDIGQWGVGDVPAAAPPPSEGSQAFLYPNQQHFLNADGGGNIRHHWWDAGSNSVTTNTWGTGIAGQPVTFIDGTSQHVFARGNDGSLRHWFWDPVNGASQDNWAPNGGLAGDPAAIMIGDYQDVWAVDGGGNLQHWYWGPSSNGVQHDTWGSGVVGRPSVFVTSDGSQHAFARGTGGTLEHWWWSQSTGILHDTWGSGLAGDPAALAIGDFQDVWAVDGGGDLQHWYWGPNTNGVQHDAWGNGVVGRPSVVVYRNGDQEAFVRGTGGTVEHFWWDAHLGISHDTWGTGISQDPTAEIIDNQQHVWAVDSAGHAQHWFWSPGSNGIQHDDWGK